MNQELEENEIKQTKPIFCPLCNKKIEGARYFIQEQKHWICTECYLKDE